MGLNPELPLRTDQGRRYTNAAHGWGDILGGMCRGFGDRSIGAFMTEGSYWPLAEPSPRPRAGRTDAYDFEKDRT